MKSSRQIDIENKVNQAFKYAVSFYNSNNRGVDNQLICLKEMMKLTGFDDKTCVQIQNPILALYSASDIIDLGNETIRQHMNIVSQNIQGRLLDLQPSTSLIPSHPKFNTSTPHIGFESHYGKDEKGNCIIAEKFSGILKHDPNALSKIKVITVADTNMDDTAVSSFSDVIQHQVFNLDGFYFHNNKIGDNGVFRLLHGVINAPEWRNIIKIDLSNNKIGDKGAYYLSDSLTYGQIPNTKYLDVSGNQITVTGESYFVKAMGNSKVQDIIVLTQKLNINSKLLPGLGTKEEKIAIYKDFIAKGKAKGTYDEGIVIDKTWWGQVKNIGNSSKAIVYGVFGFSKCHFVPEDMAIGYAQDKLIAKIPKFFGGLFEYGKKLIDAEAITTCYLGGTDDAWTSVPGMSAIKHELCLIGESEFCGE